MEMVSVNSTNIKQIGYEEDIYITMNRKTSKLRVVFQNDRVYDYYQVPIHLFNAFKEAKSKGKFFHENINNQFKYERVK